MSQKLAWREKGGRLKQVELPGFHDCPTGDDIRKRFLSFRGYQERQVYLLTVMRDYPLQVADSGLISFFDQDDKGCLTTSHKIEWLHRLAAHGNTARRAFDQLDDMQQKIILMVLPEKRSIEKAASVLRISRKHCHALYRKAVFAVFPEYTNQLPPLRKLREQLAVLMESQTSWREQSGNTEDYLTTGSPDRAGTGDTINQTKSSMANRRKMGGETRKPFLGSP